MIRTRIPSYLIKLYPMGKYTKVELYVKDQLVASTSLDRGIRATNPDVAQFIRRYFHLPASSRRKVVRHRTDPQSKFQWGPGDLQKVSD